MSRVRLQDVAERAGVSIKTVSNVVNKVGAVTPVTRLKVEDALAHLQYRPNVAARHLRHGNSGMIAVALPELTQPYFAELASELVRAAKTRTLTVLLNQTDGLPESERAIVDGIDMPLMDGLILSPLALNPTELRRRLDDGPLVLLGDRIGDSDFPHVTIDNRAAAALATRHLVDTGHRRIAAIGMQRSGPRVTSTLRLDGYRSALTEASMPWRAELVASVTRFHREDGAAAMHSLLDLPERPDAVFCFSDLLALGAMRALRDRNLSAPHDVAIIGIDDIEEGRFAAPSLSTVSPDKRQIAETAIDLLLDCKANPGQSPRTVIVGHTLIPRESTIHSRNRAS